MALSATVKRETRDPTHQNPEIQATEVLYAGAYVGGGNENHATAAKIGRAFAWNDEAGAIPLGFEQSGGTGNSAAPRVTAEVYAKGRVVERLAVTGLAGDNTDVYKLVYATDDTTFTLTRTQPNLPVGIIVNAITSSVADVYFFSFAELAILSLAGGHRKTWLIAAFTAEFAATGDLLKGIEAPCHGRILDVYAICAAAPSDADLDATINLEIGGTSVTGGVVTVAAADTVGLKKDGTEVTAENVFHSGDLIDVETTVTAAGTAGDGFYCLYVDYEPLPGL
jgi:hypothetical protein